MHDPFHAFCTHVELHLSGKTHGPLAGRTFAAKDNLAVGGFKVCSGNPDWLRTHGAASETASVIRLLLDAGAALSGKTQMDELALSLGGENSSYGTPVNPRAPDRIPGGSSSGSAAATAGGLVDFALGTDTGGSIRVPASHCGLYGFRPTHGRVPTDGLVPLAPSFDTVGWFAREPGLLRQVGHVLLDEEATGPPRGRFIISDDAFALADDDAAAALYPAVRTVADVVGSVEHVTLSPEGLLAWFDAFRVLQRREIWAALGDWVEQARPTFGASIRERFDNARSITAEQAAGAQPIRDRVRARLDALLAGDAILCLPTTPGVAPLKHSPDDVMNRWRDRTVSLTCVAGHAGLPQVTLPVAECGGCPVGLSLIAARGRDNRLLALAEVVGRLRANRR